MTPLVSPPVHHDGIPWNILPVFRKYNNRNGEIGVFFEKNAVFQIRELVFLDFWRYNTQLDGTVAQWLEQVTHNLLVAGSNPAGSTSFFFC